MLVEGYDNLLIELIGIEIITETDIAVVQTHLELDMFLLPFISITHTLDGKESSSYMFTFNSINIHIIKRLLVLY